MTTKIRTFSKTIDGAVINMPAYSEADAVKYTFDGWREVTDEIAKAAEVAKATADADSKAGAKTPPK
jgi:hypothetical protein